jgi:hypothetical protein
MGSGGPAGTADHVDRARRAVGIHARRVIGKASILMRDMEAKERWQKRQVLEKIYL